ncbi:MAG: 4'-phosphopantetheinyl transferase superfamily protein [Chitinophagaceae bacterium]|nr:4'-phosphopantetheinyl transferase superfamily protein [Chitinophagaceae bacterium]
MALFYQQDINQSSRLAVWKIEESEDFFSGILPLQKNITHPHKRLQHFAGRYLLPLLFPDFPLSQIEIADTRKPFLPEEQYHFSISHCGDFAAALVSSDKRVGIDIEIITERVHKIKHKYLHPEELLFVNQYPPEKQTELLTLLWSAKEAMFKWWGRTDVDFSESLRIDPFSLSDEGIINARFVKDEILTAIELHYKMMEGMSLVWGVEG